MATVDVLIKRYAYIAESIYNRRAAGAHTWSGVLGEFLTEADKVRSAERTEKLLALADEWDALDMGGGRYPEDTADRRAHEARAEQCADELRELLS